MFRRTAAVACAALLLTACTTDRTRRGYLRAIAADVTTPPANPVIVIPGFGVTRLLDPVIDRYVWGTPPSTMRTAWPDDLDLPADGHDRLVPRGYAGSRGAVNTGWQLMTALEKYGGYQESATLYPFHYDWRLSALDNATRLDAFAAGVRREHGGARVDVVTHSAGAIVALTWVKLGGGASAVRHLIAIAPPALGSIEAFRVVARPEQFIRRKFSPAIVATWPSVPELLPEDGAIFVDDSGNALDLDVWSRATWEHFFKGGELRQFAASLTRARAFRDRLRDAPMPPAVSLHVIAGDCVPTARRVIARKDGTFAFYPGDLRPAEAALRSRVFEPGDGTIPLTSAAALARPEIFCDGHQGIASDPNVHRALIRILRDSPIY